MAGIFSRTLIQRRNLLRYSGGIAVFSLVKGQRPVAALAEDDGIVATLLTGEPGPRSIILQARFAHGSPALGDAVSRSTGVAGDLAFELSTSADFAQSRQVSAGRVDATNDFIGKCRLDDLEPGTRYFYRPRLVLPDGTTARDMPFGSFNTLPPDDQDGPLSFVMFSCTNYARFFGIQPPGPYEQGASWLEPATGEVRARGYPAFDAIARLEPRFLIANGDTVYYDIPRTQLSATTREEMRACWQRQLAVPSLRDLLAAHGTFFMKDDHDFRFDDADNSGPELPSAETGRSVFREQVPVKAGPAYRTLRLNRHAQVWLLENRDYRSDNGQPDTLEKTIWGADQQAWLRETLVASDAAFKIIVSPNPILGPDDARKSDNHANIGGFRAEGQAFLDFLHHNNLTQSTVIVCGDRHWQYHSIDPRGVEELCCGATHRQNSRRGVEPGDASGTDPEARLTMAYMVREPEGGFMQVVIDNQAGSGAPGMTIRLWAETGELRHELRRHGRSSGNSL